MNENCINAKDILERLSEMEKKMDSIYDLESAVKDIMANENFNEAEQLNEAIESVSRVFYERETTYQGLIALYTEIYRDMKKVVK